MLSLPSGFAFYRIYNKEILNPLHDIVVSFQYEMYNYSGSPTGGLCLAFYDNAIDIPQGGGPAGALGYTNASGVLVNGVSSFSGMIGAFAGIALDFEGKFSQASEGRTTGGFYTSPNSLVIRSSEDNNYSLLSLQPLTNFTIADTLTGTQSPSSKKCRIILTNNSQTINVQLFINGYYQTITTQNLTYLPSNNIGISLTFCSEDTSTQFNLGHFNVTGTTQNDNTVSSEVVCTQVFPTLPFDSAEVESDNLWITDNYLLIESSSNNYVNLYEDQEWVSQGFQFFNSLNYDVTRSALSFKNNYLLAKGTNSLDLNLYEFKGNNWVLKNNFLTGSTFFGSVGDMDSKIDTVVYNNSNISVGVYSRTFNTWNSTQNLMTSANYVSGFGRKIKIDGNTIAITSATNTLHIFQKQNGTWIETNIFNITDGNGDYSFGFDLDLKHGIAVVGAPTQSNIYTNDGSVYIYKIINGTWQFYQKIFGSSLLGSNFGWSVKLDGQNLLIGAPGYPNSYLLNSGSAYYYKDTLNGELYQYQWNYSSSNPQPNVQYSRKLNISGNKVTVRDTNNFYVYNLLCGPQFTQYPILPACVIRLMDNTNIGIQTMVSGNFVYTMNCPYVYPANYEPSPTLCELVTIIGSTPLYSINGLNLLVPFTCTTPVTSNCELITIYGGTPMDTILGSTLLSPICC